MELVQWGISHSNSAVSFSLSSQICLFRSSLSSLPVSASSVLSVSSSRVNGGEERGKARRALAWITRGINFTFQSLLLSLISWLSGYEIFQKGLLLLWSSAFLSLSLCVNTHLTKTERQNNNFLLLFALSCTEVFPWFHPNISCHLQGGTQNSEQAIIHSQGSVCQSPP